MQWPRDWWKQLVTAVRVWVNWRAVSAERVVVVSAPAVAAAPAVAVEPLVAEAEVAALPTEPVAPNRAVRRAQGRQWRLYEKQRRKFDKFVEPQGEPPRLPEPKEVTAAPKAKPASAPEPEPGADVWNGEYIVDTHHSDRTTKVLYDVREMLGEFNFRDTVLEQLERYYVYLERMRKHDKEAYVFYGHVGAQLVPYAGIGDIWHPSEPPCEPEYVADEMPSAWFMRTRPVFGCIAYGTAPEIEKIERGEYCQQVDKKKWRLIPKFMYFVKYMDHAAPPEVQPKSGGDIYKMTIWWDRTDAKRYKYGVPEDFPVFVGADGRVEVLRTISTEMLPIYSKKYGVKRIPQRAWKLPHHADDWAKQHKTTAKLLINNLFCSLTRHVEYSAYSMARVSVVNGKGQHALFSLDPRRMAYFFQDRDYELTEDGQRKRIFHVVSPHVRSDGVAVAMHFRGVREFNWAGYKVKITVPGKDHRMLEEVDIGMRDAYWTDGKRDTISEGEVGRFFRALMDGKKLRVEDLRHGL